MTQSSYVPEGDAEFNLWQGSLITLVQANATAWGISAADLAAIIVLQTGWNTTFGKASNKQNRTPADVQAKDDARKLFEPALRKFVAQWLANNAKVANSERQRMGLTVKTGTRTANPVPDTCPVAVIDFSARLRHSIAFADESTPASRAKPDGVHGCEVWMKLGGDAPQSHTECTYLATDTASPYVATFDGQDSGKTAWYMLRWVNTRGERGPWSQTFKALVN